MSRRRHPFLFVLAACCGLLACSGSTPRDVNYGDASDDYGLHAPEVRPDTALGCAGQTGTGGYDQGAVACGGNGGAGTGADGAAGTGAAGAAGTGAAGTGAAGTSTNATDAASTFDAADASTDG